MVKKIRLSKVKLGKLFSNKSFLRGIHVLEIVVAKVLAVALAIVIFISIFDLILALSLDLFAGKTIGRFDTSVIEIFGLFLNVLIALELMENITSYLKKHVIQLELVVITALIAVSRKIIIFDFSKFQNIDLLALGIAILSLSISYWLIKRTNQEKL